MPLANHWNGSALRPTDAYGGPAKWGTGISPVLGSRNGGYGRGTAIYGNSQDIPAELVANPDDPVGAGDHSDFMPEDSNSSIWGYGFDTGTAVRESLGGPEADRSTADGSNGDFPSWGERRGGVPGGNAIRSRNIGAEATNTAKESLAENDAASGWENKQTGDVLDSMMADTSQLYMNTSSVQRDKVRAGSQISGTASMQDAPIPSRIPGMRIKIFSMGHRLAEMEPRRQGNTLRSFWGRSAATGDPISMQVNEMYRSVPFQRTPPPAAPQGPEIAGNNDLYSDEHGYTAEDGSWV